MAFIDQTSRQTREQVIALARRPVEEGGLPELTNFSTGGFWRRILELVAKVLQLGYDWLNLHLPQAFPQSASGVWLKYHARAITGLEPRDAIATEGYGLFARTSNVGVTPIPAGTVIASVVQSGGARVLFETLEATTISNGHVAAVARIRCLQPGIVGNIADGTFEAVPVITIPGVEACGSFPFASIRLYRDSGTDPIVIPAAMRIQAPSSGDPSFLSQVYQTTQQYTMPGTDTYIDVEGFAEAEYPSGTASPNVNKYVPLEPCSMTVLSPPSDLSSTATNLSRTTWIIVPGTEAEDDVQILERYHLAWTGSGEGSPLDRFESEARRVAGVRLAKAYRQPRGQGTVDVRIWTEAGSPSAALLATVRAALLPLVKDFGDLQVKAADADAQTLQIKYVYDANLISTADADAALLVLVQAHFNFQQTYPDIYRLGIEPYWYPAEMAANIMRYRPTGIKSVKVTSPSSDAVAIADGGIPTFGSISWTRQTA